VINETTYVSACKVEIIKSAVKLESQHISSLNGLCPHSTLEHIQCEHCALSCRPTSHRIICSRSVAKNVNTLTETLKSFTHYTEESASWEVENAENCKLEPSLLTWKEITLFG